MKTPRTFAQLVTDPRVASHSDERGGHGSDGLWLYLKPGWVWDNCTTAVREETVRDCARALSDCRYSPDAWLDVVGAHRDVETGRQRFFPAG